MGGLRAGVEIALWDITGKKPGVPDRTGLGVELDEEAIAAHLPTDTPMWA